MAEFLVPVVTRGQEVPHVVQQRGNDQVRTGPGLLRGPGRLEGVFELGNGLAAVLFRTAGGEDRRDVIRELGRGHGRPPLVR
jgi:hypothetical protein